MKDAQLTKDGFEHKWLKQVRNGHGYMLSYHLAETEHINTFGTRRYSDYKSFARSRDYKRK